MNENHVPDRPMKKAFQALKHPVTRDRGCVPICPQASAYTCFA